MRKKLHKKTTLNKRMSLIIIGSILPLALIMTCMLWALIEATNAYGEINKNVTYANQYVRDFKEKIDYTAYIAVIDNKKFEELDIGKKTVNGVVTVNPYSYSYELQNACDKLAESTTVKSNKSAMISTKHSVESLKNCLHSLEDSIEEKGNYDENMQMLNNDIYTLTAVIQDGIQEYIYLETSNIVHVKTALDKKNRELIAICIITLCLAVILDVFLTINAARSVSVPIKKLCKLTDKVAEGDFTVQSKVESTYEIAVLNRNFNNMTKEIGKLVEDIKKQQKNLRMIEIKLLQAQINPHFLYNTLDTIVWLAEAGQKEQVVSMVTYLSDFFRTTLSGGRDIITIRDEKKHIESYLKIQKFRYVDIMDYEVEMDEEILNCAVPKLTLQPLVENALLHGIREKRGKGKVTVTGKKQGEDIVFSVKDNGKGMNKETLTKLQHCMEKQDNLGEDSAFGLVNVNQRIQNYYGEKYGLHFESEENMGTEVSIVISSKNIESFS